MNAPARIGIVIDPKLQTGMTRHLLKGTQAGSGSDLGLPSGAHGLTHPTALPLHAAWHARVTASSEKCTLQEALQQAWCKVKRVFPVLASAAICPMASAAICPMATQNRNSYSNKKAV